jgi:hypothetical protein
MATGNEKKTFPRAILEAFYVLALILDWKKERKRRLLDRKGEHW